MFSVARFMGIWFPVQIPPVGPGRDVFLLNYKIVVVVTVSTQAVSHPLSQWPLSEVIQTHKKSKALHDFVVTMYRKDNFSL